jgi:cathepsin B
MKFIIIALMLFAATFAKHPVNKEIVEEIKKLTTQWWPVEPENNIFQFHNAEQISSMLGTKMDLERDIKVAEEMGIFDYNLESVEAVPAAFDSREEWGAICPFDIKDQGQCGSCWAFGAVESLEDRICIHSNGSFQADLSEQHLVACDWVGMGCQGGWPLSAFGYMAIFGLPTEECQPYHAGESGSAWGCSSTCEDSNTEFKKYRCKTPWLNFSNSGIKNEIKARGPVEGTMMVYEDFINYHGGIYKHVTGSLLGGHAIKMLGWGEEEGVKYWIAANSWSTSWGEEGYFRIEEGTSSFGSSAYSCTTYDY